MKQGNVCIVAFGLDSSISNRIKASYEQIDKFCQRWNIAELALFGSVLRDDFHAESDIDVLLTFKNYDDLNFPGWMSIKGELAEMLGRKVDIADKACLDNPYRRHEILKTHRVIYVND